jgi:hypothetical protein
MNFHGNGISSDCAETLKPNFVRQWNHLSNPSQKIARKELQNILHDANMKIAQNKSERFLKDVILQQFPNGFDLYKGNDYPDLLLGRQMVLLFTKLLNNG